MAARKLIYHLMILSPTLLLGSIAMEARWMSEPYDEGPVAPMRQEQVNAYIPFVRECRQNLGEGSRATPDDIRELALRWVAGTESGRLEALPPSHFDDSPREGARGQIFDARNKLVNALQLLARREWNRGRHDRAAEDCLLAIRVCEAMKYSELYTVGTSTLDQRSSLGWLADLWPNLSTTTRERVRQAARDVLACQRPLDKVIARFRQQFVEASAHRELPHLSIDQVQQLASIDRMLSHDANPQLIIHQIKTSLDEARGETMPLFLSTVKMGIQSQELLKERLVALIER